MTDRCRRVLKCNWQTSPALKSPMVELFFVSGLPDHRIEPISEVVRFPPVLLCKKNQVDVFCPPPFYTRPMERNPHQSPGEVPEGREQGREVGGKEMGGPIKGGDASPDQTHRHLVPSPGKPVPAAHLPSSPFRSRERKTSERKNTKTPASGSFSCFPACRLVFLLSFPLIQCMNFFSPGRDASLREVRFETGSLAVYHFISWGLSPLRRLKVVDR